jgi:hypothetical protein
MVPSRNGGLAIDLGSDRITANDPLDLAGVGDVRQQLVQAGLGEQLAAALAALAC